MGTDLEELGLSGLSDEDAHDAVLRLGFSVAGEGHFATVYVRSDLPDFAVRVSTAMDGWAAYGLGIRSGALDDLRFAPAVHDIRLLDGDGYVALTERLRPASTEDEERAAAVVSDLMRDPASVDRDALAAFPGIGSFVAEVVSFLGRSYLDPKDGNVLFRGDGTPIVNDPCGRILSPEFRKLVGLGCDEPDDGFGPG